MRKTAFLLLAGLLLVGCATTPPVEVTPHKVTNVALDPVESRQVRSIAVFPINDPQDLEGVGERMGEIISLQVLKIGRFKIVEPIKVNAILERQRLAFSRRFTVGEMLKIGKEMGVDAIIFGQLTAYRAYGFFPERIVNRETPAIVGLNLKMISTRNNNVVWAASDTFNGGDEAITTLVPREERWKVKVDIDFLSTLLVRELTKTLNY